MTVLFRAHRIVVVKHRIFCSYISRVQLGVCISQIVKQDFPGKWPGIAEKVMMYLKSDRHDTWSGALVCLHQLVKHFEYVCHLVDK